MPAPSDIYPLSTAKGDAIPLAVAAPLGAVHVAVAAGVQTPITLPDSANLCSVYFDQDVELWTTAYSAIADGTYKPGCIVLMGGVVHDLLLPASVILYGHNLAATGFINVLVTWAQLQNSGSYEAS